MTCEICTSEFVGMRCACGWEAPKLAPVAKTELWIIRECEAEGCTAMIRERPGAVSSRFCKWCQARGIRAAKVPMISEDSRYLSRAEFGETLYRVNGLYAGREQLRGYYRLAVTDLDLSVDLRKRKLADLKQRDADLAAQIVELIPMLDPDDIRRLTNQYEAVGAA